MWTIEEPCPFKENTNREVGYESREESSREIEHLYEKEFFLLLSIKKTRY